VSAFMITQVQVGDYDTWKPMFDQDRPRAREDATWQRVFRSVDDPNQVFIFLEFASVDGARQAQRRLLGSGVFDRFAAKHVPRVVTEANSSSASGP
jgi:hypothetical protein